MTRMEVLSWNPRAGPEEYYKPAVRDERVLERAGRKFRRLLNRREKPPFCKDTGLILNAACSQYLGYYPAQTPSRSEIKAILREMARMHAQRWESGIGCMENCFHGTEKAIREIRRYAKENGILPDSR